MNGNYLSVLKEVTAMIYAVLLVLLSKAICYVMAPGEIVADLLMTLKYSNPKNIVDDGDPCDFWITDAKCDVYFEICVSSNAQQRCDLLSRMTDTFTEQDHIEFANDGRINIPLPSPVPSSLWIKVVAWDRDSLSVSDLIGNFSINGSLENLLQKEESLQPQYMSSSRVSMKLELKCRKNWFGKLCETHCNPTNNALTCDENGNAICMPGYSGPSCTLKDYCYFKPCAPNAQCENTNEGFKCICDGKDDAKCYANYKPCLNDTCSGHGVCKPSPESPDGFVCECETRWRGKRCEIRLDACEFEENRLKELNAEETTICLNNGTCFNDPNGLDFHCQCPPDWEGNRCEKSIYQRLAISISTPIVVLFFLVMIMVEGILVAKQVSRRKRLLQNGFIYTTDARNKTMTMPIDEIYTGPDRGSIHIYAEIGDPYMPLGNGDLITKNELIPLHTLNQHSDSESPPIPRRNLRQKSQANENMKIVPLVSETPKVSISTA